MIYIVSGTKDSRNFLYVLKRRPHPLLALTHYTPAPSHTELDNVLDITLDVPHTELDSVFVGMCIESLPHDCHRC